MQDVELHRQLLGLNTPWAVMRVELKVKEHRVEVWVGHAESARWPCPECATELALYDHAEGRKQASLDGYFTDLTAAQRAQNGAVDRERRGGHGRLRAQGDLTLNVLDRHHERFTELTLRRSRKPLKTAQAWAH